MEVTVERISGRRLAVEARGVTTIVDDTVEDGGPGDGFRPTELLLAGLGACMLGTVINFAANEGITIGNVSLHLEDQVEKAPSRLGSIEITLTIETDADDRQMASLARVADACKIHNTLENPPAMHLNVESAPLA